MSTVNDQRILELKKQIQSKKQKIGKKLRFTPITNCSIELDGERQNIQALNKDQLLILLVKLNSYMLSAKDLNVLDKFTISGYSVEDWISDINSKIEILSRRDEERMLKSMEDKLVKLLSEGKKVELEIDEIESLLTN
ncbi:hypothetical protein V1503_19520 [Bacillus sp. SCS-151]|uniref:hypothetical protein n=1 Tax=Nanhaiella sioensis TaxID=3115293 RepID=UPI00397E5E5A